MLSGERPVILDEKHAYLGQRPPGLEPAKVLISTGRWTGRPHLSVSGNLYYTAGGDLYRVGFSEGGYLEPEKLPGEINAEAYGELDPCIAPDEDFIVFFSSQPGGYSSKSSEVYVCFWTEDGRWTSGTRYAGLASIL